MLLNLSSDFPATSYIPFFRPLSEYKDTNYFKTILNRFFAKILHLKFIASAQSLTQQIVYTE